MAAARLEPRRPSVPPSAASVFRSYNYPSHAFVGMAVLLRTVHTAAGAATGAGDADAGPPGAAAEVLMEALDVFGRLGPSSPSRFRGAFGYSACVDVAVSAPGFIQLVIERFGLKAPRPRYHATLRSVVDFVESFLYFFAAGANAEQRMEGEVGQQAYRQLVEIAKGNQTSSYAGGNALTMARRVAKEGGHAVLSARLNENLRQQLRGQPGMKLVEPQYEGEGIDVHLALEYQADDAIANISSRRSNRYYLNADDHNSRFTAIHALHRYMMSLPPEEDQESFAFVVTGLQLLQAGSGLLHSRLREIGRALDAHNGKGVSHLESGSLGWSVLEASWANRLFFRVNSLGLNEQELAALDWRLMHSGPPPEQAFESAPTLQSTLDVQRRVFVALATGGRMTRLHLHTLRFHSLCYLPSRWMSGSASVAAGVRVAANMTCGSALALGQFDRFVPPESGVAAPRFRASVAEAGRGGEDEEVQLSGGRPGICVRTEERPVATTYDPTPDERTVTVECCIALSLLCRLPLRTAGVGDSISGAGLAYHRPRSPQGEATRGNVRVEL